MTESTPSLSSPNRAGLYAALVAFATFIGILANGFAGDGLQVLTQPVFREIASDSSALPQLWQQSYWGADEISSQQGLYRPLTTSTLGIQVAATGHIDRNGDSQPDSETAALPYHLIDLLLYGAVAWAAVALLAAWGAQGRLLLAAGLLFAAHPVHTEVLADIAGRAELLAALLLLVGLRLHATSTRASTLALGGLLVALAIFAKEGAVVAGLWALLFDLLLRRDEGSATARLLPRAPFYLVAAAGLAINLWARHTVLGQFGIVAAPALALDNPLLAASTGERLMTAIANFGRLWGQGTLPLRLSADYSASVLPVGSGLGAAAGALAILVPLGIGWALRRRTPLILAGALLADLAFLLPSNLLFPVGTIFADRLLFLPSLGITLWLGGLLVTLLEARSTQLAMACVGVLTVAGAARSWAQVPDWKDNTTLWNATVRTVPESSRAHYNVGIGHMLLNYPDDAEAEFELAIQKCDANWQAHLDLARVRRKLGTEREDDLLKRASAAQYERALGLLLENYGGEIDLIGQVTYELRQLWGSELGETEQAMRALARLEQLQPSSWINLYRGELLLRLDQPEQAVESYRLAMAPLASGRPAGAEGVARLSLGKSFLLSDDRAEEGRALIEGISVAFPTAYADGNLHLAEWERAHGELAESESRLRSLVDNRQLPWHRRDAARFGLAATLVARGDAAARVGEMATADSLYEEAMHTADDGLATSPFLDESWPAYYLSATIHHQRGEASIAVAKLREVIQALPEAADARRMAAGILFNEGKPADALDLFRDVLSLSVGTPLESQDAVFMARLHATLEDYEAAEATFRATLERLPEDPWLHQNFALLLFEMGQKEACLASFDRALELLPPGPQADAVQQTREQLSAMKPPR